MLSVIFIASMLIILVGIFYLRFRFIKNNLNKISRLLCGSTPLILALHDYAKKAGVREVRVLGNIFAENEFFPKPQLRFWLSNTILKEITVPAKKVLFLLENKFYAIFEIEFAHEIGHQIVGIEKGVLQQECGVYSFSCPFDEIRAWRRGLEIIHELSCGIDNWKPQMGKRFLSLNEVYSVIEDTLNKQCKSCCKPVDSRQCPRADVIKATRMHIKAILKIKS